MSFLTPHQSEYSAESSSSDFTVFTDTGFETEMSR
jgi:hypothetical protein